LFSTFFPHAFRQEKGIFIALADIFFISYDKNASDSNKNFSAPVIGFDCSIENKVFPLRSATIAHRAF